MHSLFVVDYENSCNVQLNVR